MIKIKLKDSFYLEYQSSLRFFIIRKFSLWSEHLNIQPKVVKKYSFCYPKVAKTGQMEDSPLINIKSRKNIITNYVL